MLKVLGPGRVVISAPGVQVSRLHDGKHQGYAHVREGTFWEACFQPSFSEVAIQSALLDKSYALTHQHVLVRDPAAAYRPRYHAGVVAYTLQYETEVK